MRSIVFLLAATALIAGCDKAQPPQGQANASSGGELTLDQAANAEPGLPVPPGNDVDIIGKLDRSHKSEAAPTAEFTGPDGAKLTLAKFAGKPVLLNLWATWCGPCIAELPTLDRLAGEGKLTVLTVSQDLDGAKLVNPYFARKKFAALKAYIDPDLHFSTALGNPSLPTTILYDAAGKEVWRMTGGMDWTSPSARELVGEAS